METSKQSLAIALVALAAAGLSVEAHVSKQFNSLNSYWLLVYHVPDFDQVRTVLPGQGSQYCSPTSALDWIAYFANHGADVSVPGPTNWGAQANYDLVSSLIDEMGSCSYMCTNADPDDGGTEFVNIYNGLRLWLGNEWIVQWIVYTEDMSPSFGYLSNQAMNGAYLLPSITFYEDTGLCMQSDGAHMVAITGMVRGDDLHLMKVSDPGTADLEVPSNSVIQSSFTTETYQCIPVVRNPNCSNPDWVPREMWRVEGLTRDGGQKLGYIDAAVLIVPKTALSDTGTGEITYAALEVGGGIEPFRNFVTVDDRPIVNGVLGPTIGQSIVILGATQPGGADEVWVHTPGFEQWQQVDIGAESPTDLVSSRHREVYVVEGDRLIIFDIDTLQVEDEVQMPAVGQALAYDDDSDEVLVLSTQEHVIMRYAHGLQEPPVLQFLDDLPVGEDASIAWDPTDGSVWAIVAGDAWVYRVTFEPGEATVDVAEIEGLTAPQAIDVDDDGRVYVSDEGVIKEYAPENGYGPPDQPFFEGRQAGQVLSIARSRTNYRAELIADQDWSHALPTEFGESVPNCFADIDGDGQVTVDDLVAVILAWDTADPFADIAPDGGDLIVGVDDLVAVILAWGPCEQGL